MTDKQTIIAWLQSVSTDCIGLESLDWTKALKIKWGCDPTGSDLHLGHVLIMKRLRHLQDLGHVVDLVIGDYTAAIGDPSGKKSTRPPLTREQVLEHARTYTDQVFQFLDKDKTNIHFNSTWLDKLNLEDIVRLATRVPVGRLLARVDFKDRLRTDKPFALHELLYPLLVAYDSVVLDSDIEVGGQDQRLNLLMGRYLMGCLNNVKEQAIITFPLLPGINTGEKMSKTAGNFVSTKSDNTFGLIMSMSDESMNMYYDILLIERVGESPLQQKTHLAYSITRLLHNEDRAIEEKERFFNKDLAVKRIDVGYSHGILLRTLLAQAGIVESSSAAYRLIQQGGITVDGKVLYDVDQMVHIDKFTCRVGKRKIVEINNKGRTL